MKKYQRLAIVDKSLLAHNVYRMLFKPLGFSLFCYKSLHDLRQNCDPNLSFSTFLVNSNALGKNFDRHVEWLKGDSMTRSIPKIFLCKPKEKKIHIRLKGLPKCRFIFKPFYPLALEKTLQGFFKERR